MKRSWGQNWIVLGNLSGESLSFQVRVSDGKMLQFDNVVSGNWKVGQEFDGKINF